MTLRDDHLELTDAAATRRYFTKFDRIIKHLRDVTEAAPERSGGLAESQLDAIETYIDRLANTFHALSYKHLMAHAVSTGLPHRLEIDRRDSGFPVYREILQMANDVAEAGRRLTAMPSRETLKSEMVKHILQTRTAPRRLQFAMSQRVYFEALQDGDLFLAQNHPQCAWAGKSGDRRRHLIHWAVYDSQSGIPTIYLMVVEDSGTVPLPKDETRWPQAMSHLLAQAMSQLNLSTIASGFDRDFDDLHPKFLRRIHIGPMYSHTFTEQEGPLRDILAEAAGEPGSDWALAWTTETLVSLRTERESTGLFGSVDREVFHLDAQGRKNAESRGARTDRSLIIPYRPFQVLAHRDPQGLRDVRRYVVGEDGRVLTGA